MPLCAIGTLLAAFAGCLNPLPDDFPNDRGSEPDESAGGSPANLPSDPSDGPVFGGGSEVDGEDPAAPPSAQVPDPGDAGAPAAAGCDAGVADAGAPDATDAGEAGP